MSAKKKAGFSVSIEKDSIDTFRKKCKENHYNIGKVVQSFVDKFNEDKVVLRMTVDEEDFNYVIEEILP